MKVTQKHTEGRDKMMLIFLKIFHYPPHYLQADTKISTAQQGTFWYKIACMPNASPISISRNQRNTCESEIWGCWLGGDKMKYKVGKGTIYGHGGTTHVVLAKIPGGNPNSWLVWFLECWVWLWPTENKWRCQTFGHSTKEGIRRLRMGNCQNGLNV